MRTLSLLAIVVLLSGCSLFKRQAQAADGVTVSDEEFKLMKWISGEWIGIEPNAQAFAESYEILDDSTVRSYSWADTTFQQITDSSFITLRHGEVTSGSGESYWVLTRWKGVVMHFEPRGKATNAFTWSWLNINRWNATLTWTDSTGTLQRRGYQMVRRQL